jgi:hypothetical protein
MNNEYEKIDFFIPLHRYHPLFQSCVEAIIQFYDPRTIYIVTSIPEIDKIKKCVPLWNTGTHTFLCFINEDTFFQSTHSISKEEIKNKWYIYKDEQSREFGWWYQQILKLGAIKKIPQMSDPFIIWDSDLVPIQKWPIYPTVQVPFFQFALLQEKEKSLFNKTQYNDSIFDLLKLPEISPSESKGTFVPHHFVFHHKVIHSLIDYIETIHHSSEKLEKERKTWIEIIVSLSKNYYRFSEYKSMATFMSFYFPELLHYHPFQEYGEKGIRIRDSQEAHCFLEDLEKNLKKNTKKGKKEKTNEKEKSDLISYKEFCHFVKEKYKDDIPSYIQVEHL